MNSARRTGVEFIAMEFVDGPSLKELLASGKALPWQRSVSMMHEIAAGLMHAHARGIVHRDIKPGNILLPARGPIKLVDFGLAVDLAHAPATFAGTPEYTSPEQARSRPVDQRADIFSLGATFYHALTGVSPFRADGWTESLMRVVEYQPPAPSSVVKAVPRKLDEIVLRCLAKDPAERYSDLSLAIADLKKLLDSPAARVQEEAVSSLAAMFAEHEVVAVVAAAPAFAVTPQ